MSNKRFWGSIVAVWFVLMATDWFFHGIWMKSWYAETMQLWRSPEEMQSSMWAMWLGRLIFSWAFVWIYSKGLSNDNKWWQAFRYALAIVLVAEVPHQLGTWAVSPYPFGIIWRWVAIATVQAVAASFVMTWTFNPLAWAQKQKTN